MQLYIAMVQEAYQRLPRRRGAGGPIVKAAVHHGHAYACHVPR
jgi:hypothetical protein